MNSALLQAWADFHDRRVSAADAAIVDPAGAKGVADFDDYHWNSEA